MKHIPDISRKFAIEGIPDKVSQAGSGHINDSYLITTSPEACPDYVLQRINHQIFLDIPALMTNIVRVTEHIWKKLTLTEGVSGRHEQLLAGSPAMQALRLVKTRDGAWFHQDPQGNFWRLYHHIAGSHSYDRVPGPGYANEGGKAFGQFLQLTSGLDPASLAVTIPRFHDIAWRMEQFDEAISHDCAGRVSRIPDLISFVRVRSDEMHTIHRLQEAGQLPDRVTHNDTKFNNILFAASGRAVCIVDLDTVMPGTILFDFGDAIRTGANTVDEDEPDLSRVALDMDLYSAYTKGFLETAGGLLSKRERDLLAHSARFMTFLIGLRFLTDYLNGDVYYKIRRPEHNLERARCQFRLLSEMEKQGGEMERIVCSLVKLISH